MIISFAIKQNSVEVAFLLGELVRALGGAVACPSLLGVPLGHNSSFLQGPAFDLLALGRPFGVVAQTQQLKKKLGEGVYISTDVDCLGPAFAPGVSHIEPGGLSFSDVLNILHNLQGNVVAADVVKFNPQRDTVDRMTAMVAAKLRETEAAPLSYTLYRYHLPSPSKMAAPSALSRLNFLPKPYIFRALNNFHRSQLRPKWAFPASSISKTSSMGRVSFSSVPFNSTSEEVSNEISKRDGDLIVLGIETSCDDTAAAVVRSNGEILSEVVSSQADLLVKYGGVAPKMAEEAHSQVIDQVVQEALDKAYLAEKDLSAVAVTIGPGLSLCLRVGVQKARRIAGGFNLPTIGIHHMEAYALVARCMLNAFNG
ncbi:putative tRNA N6-adenosine threonylcarbamoyltransferase, mitochondrial [Senna tora]|uniref:N(6)-L-threonylcarbamoyladenine synthase n=1 Tax=Senna tora TaxID=362788 RepID=A0A834WNQ7_9FABA|nr:putative tRNA N6-adenosine threonylcarbamoyltransferase, mitochondrial [Senna tora]